MKTILNFLSVIAFSAVLAGCSAQKHAAKSDAVSAESKILHQQALTALEAGRFIIEAEEFYFPGPDSRTKQSTGSYLSLRDNLARLVYTPDLFPRTPLEHLNIVDNSTELKKETEKRNGDMQFSLKLDGGKNYLKRRMLITCYKNTNRCFVQELSARSNETIMSFSGKIYPL